MPVRAKICGLSTADTVDAAIRHGAAHLGFNFFAASPRYVAPDAAAGLIARVPSHVASVGVFVDPDDETIERALAAGTTALQLHGGEPPERVAELRSRHGLDVWKAIAVRTAADLAAAKQYRGAATRILYDAKTPAGAALPGGMGLRFDWRLLEGFDHPLPWALSGGLDDDNVAEAVAVTGARLIDVSSGVESAPGIKDVDKIAAFLQSTAQL